MIISMGSSKMYLFVIVFVQLGPYDQAVQREEKGKVGSSLF